MIKVEKIDKPHNILIEVKSVTRREKKFKGRNKVIQKEETEERYPATYLPIKYRLGKSNSKVAPFFKDIKVAPCPKIEKIRINEAISK